MSIFELMAAPFAECLVLVAIHTYLGIHVLKRRVIFVDLALAQIAALGTTVGFLFGIMPETPGALLFSMAFAFVGAAVFSVTRFRHEKVPQEAVIGLTYAICCAVAVLVVEKTRGAEHLKDILTGNLLWVTWSDVVLAALVYSVIGVVHYVFRQRLWLISEDPEGAYRAGLSVRAWDFLFYVTFGIVITFSTRVAGVLLVFVFLVAPAILAFLLTSQRWLQLLIGWGTGTVVTVGGLYLSWSLDLPSGPTVIAFYGIALVAGATAVYLARAERRMHALRVVLLGAGLTAVLGLALWGGGQWVASSGLGVSEAAHHVEADLVRQQAAATLSQSQQQTQQQAGLATNLGECAQPEQLKQHLSLPDPEAQLAHIREQLAQSKSAGLSFLLIALADDELPLLYREEAVELLRQATGQSYGYNAEAEVRANAQSIRQICQRLQTGEPGAIEPGP